MSKYSLLYIPPAVYSTYVDYYLRYALICLDDEAVQYTLYIFV